jgi:uncharacterized protein
MNKLFAIALALFSTIAFAEAEPPQLPKINLSVGTRAIVVEVASIPSDRAQGLMFRKKMANNEGMLFVYPQPHITGMWMKNTLIPLSVAFIDEKGAIINIEEMKPETLDAHMAKAPAKYSLEMSSGWFKKHKLGPGTKIKGLEKAPEPQ